MGVGAYLFCGLNEGCFFFWFSGSFPSLHSQQVLQQENGN